MGAIPCYNDGMHTPRGNLTREKGLAASARFAHLAIVTLMLIVVVGTTIGCTNITEPITNEPVDGVLTVHYLDVGHAESTFIELPDGQTMLIDAGRKGAGPGIVAHIEALGYVRIDYLVATHPHDDHIGGMLHVVEAFDIGEVWMPGFDHRTQIHDNFVDALDAGSITTHTAWAGDRLHTAPGLTVDILSPIEGVKYSNSDPNDWSIIIELIYGDTAFLFTGDAKTSIILAATDNVVDVLQVGHHGSKTSTNEELVSILSPSYAIISVGEGNRYGHPDAVVLDALSSVKVYRTDMHGNIVVTSDGTNITVYADRNVLVSHLLVYPTYHASFMRRAA